MKKIVGVILSALFTNLYANSAADATIVFSTVGPDAYADGSTVLDGELYALVWSMDGVFEGFSADGRSLDAKDKILVAAPLAKGGRCPKVMFQIPAADAADCGKFEIFLMDTRVSSASGDVAPRGSKEGVIELLNGYGKVAADISVAAPSARSENAAVANLNAAAPKNSRQPRVRAMRMEGDEVVLTVENIPGFMRVQSGRDASAADSTGAALQTSGSGDTLTIKAPKVGDRGFYRVIHNPIW